MLIIFEGIEGAGKTTHLNLLAQNLKERGFPVVASTQEPGWGEDHLSGILKHLINQPSVTSVEKLFLLLADRAGHYARFISPLMREKHCRPIILCERGPDSTIAYQGFGTSMLSPEILRLLNQFATSNLMSHTTFVLDAEPAIALNRTTKKDKFDLSNQNVRDFYDRVREGYDFICKSDPQRYVRVHTAEAITNVQEKIMKVISAELNL